MQEQDTTIKQLKQQIATLTPPTPFTLTQQTKIQDEMDEEGDVTLSNVDEDGLFIPDDGKKFIGLSVIIKQADVNALLAE